MLGHGIAVVLVEAVHINDEDYFVTAMDFGNAGNESPLYDEQKPDWSGSSKG